MEWSLFTFFYFLAFTNSCGSSVEHLGGPFWLQRAWLAEIFPNVHILLKILTTLPVITAEPERLFSKLNNTLSAIMSTMKEGRLESLLLIKVHRD